jgi:hypothetical protein
MKSKDACCEGQEDAMRLRTQAVVFAVAAMTLLGAYAARAGTDDTGKDLREAFGEPGAALLDEIGAQSPELHGRALRFLRRHQVLHPRMARVARLLSVEFLRDGDVRKAVATRLVARYRLHRAVKAYEEAKPEAREALKPKVREALQELFKAKDAACELRLRKLRERQEESRKTRDEDIRKFMETLD